MKLFLRVAVYNGGVFWRECWESIKENLDIFTILEGKIWEKKDVTLAFEAGADAVVVGSAITRPQLIFKRLNEGKINE